MRANLQVGKNRDYRDYGNITELEQEREQARRTEHETTTTGLRAAMERTGIDPDAPLTRGSPWTPQEHREESKTPIGAQLPFWPLFPAETPKAGLIWEYTGAIRVPIWGAEGRTLREYLIPAEAAKTARSAIQYLVDHYVQDEGLTPPSSARWWYAAQAIRAIASERDKLPKRARKAEERRDLARQERRGEWLALVRKVEAGA